MEISRRSLVYGVFGLCVLGLVVLVSILPFAWTQDADTVGKTLGKFGNPLGYRKITAEEAHAMMRVAKNFVLLDVRVEFEYREKHITGAILLPYNEIMAQAEKVIPNKSTPVFIYCRTGRRSEIAALDMVKLGYTNVYEFGSLQYWKHETTP